MCIRDSYKAAVSCSGNHDNSIYNRGWGECYNGVSEVEKVVKDSLGNEPKEYEYKFRVDVYKRQPLQHNMRKKVPKKNRLNPMSLLYLSLIHI